MYYIGDEYKGIYSNNPDVVSVTTGADDFGLDAIEPLFFHPLPGNCDFQSKECVYLWRIIFAHKYLYAFPNSEWIGYGDFSVFLK